MNGPELEEEVRALERLDLEALRAAWRARYGAPPKLRSPDVLRALLAWRIQADAQGGLDGETQRLLRMSSPRRGLKLDVGVRLAREWKGVRHEVEVAEKGFTYAGVSYASLSSIARQITGVRWNGPRFFGLRAEAAP